MKVFKSRKIKEYGCLIPTEIAFESISELIAAGEIQIETTEHQNHNSPFTKILARIKMLRSKLRTILGQLEDLDLGTIKRFSDKETKQYINSKTRNISKKHQDFLLYLDEFEGKCETEMEGTEIIVVNNATLKAQLESALDELNVARIKMGLLDQHQTFINMPDHIDLDMIAGSCKKEDQSRLERMIFRVSKGNSFCYFRDIDPQQNKSLAKVTFLILASGDKTSYIHKRIIRLLESLECRIFNLPNTQKELEQHVKILEKNIKDTKPLLTLSEKNLQEQVQYYTASQESPRIIEELTQAIYFERIAYILTHQEDLVSGNNLIIKFYRPEGLKPLPTNLAIFQPSVQKNNKTSMPRLDCLFEVNQLVEMFAIPKNTEIIPSVFMLSTVPILFGMMFSDFGHGLLIIAISFSVGASPFWKLMGLMSMYFGALFNEFFGMKVTWFYGLSDGRFGLAPVWGRAENDLAFENSLKMKLSMIAAFVQMLFGSVINVVNNINQKKRSILYLQSIPKLILLVSTVGYLNFLIVYKWTIDWTGRESEAPSIIGMYLDMFLGFKTRQNTLYPSIKTEILVAKILKIINIVCLVFIMLGTEVFDRFIARRESRAHVEQGELLQQDVDQQVEELEQDPALENKTSQQPKAPLARKISKVNSHVPDNLHQQQERLFGPIQGFQYILSLISSTTSYLRLFALSLAHQKLSILLFGFFLSSASSASPSFVWLSLKSIVFFYVTVGMMLMLDVLECMMHVIRLHWVQWMGRFYQGGGDLFEPEQHIPIEQ